MSLSPLTVEDLLARSLSKVFTLLPMTANIVDLSLKSLQLQFTPSSYNLSPKQAKKIILMDIKSLIDNLKMNSGKWLRKNLVLLKELVSGVLLSMKTT